MTLPINILQSMIARNKVKITYEECKIDVLYDWAKYFRQRDMKKDIIWNSITLHKAKKELKALVKIQKALKKELSALIRYAAYVRWQREVSSKMYKLSTPPKYDS